MWWKKNKGRLLALLVIAAALTAAFFWDGGAGSTPARADGAAKPVTDAQPSHTAGTESPAQDTPASPADSGAAPLDTAPPPEAAPPAPQPETPDPADSQTPEAGTPPEAAPQEKEKDTCTMSISCASILDNMADLDPAKTELVPKGGWILPPAEVALEEGESLFDLLLRVCRAQGIHMEYTDTPMYDSAYIEGIANLYEFDCGPLSGWMYKINGVFPNYGCSRCMPQAGDVVEWVYTCDLGEDVGGGGAVTP